MKTLTTHETRHRLLTLLAWGDGLLWLAALFAAYPLRFFLLPFIHVNPPVEISFAGYLPIILLFGMGFSFSAFYSGCYREVTLLRLRNLFVPLGKTLLFWVLGVFALIGVLNQQPDVSRFWLALSFVLGLAFLTGWRAFFHFFIAQRKRDSIRLRAAFYGWDDDIAELDDALRRSQAYTVWGYFQGKPLKERPCHLPLMGDPKLLEDALRGENLDILLVSETLPPEEKARVQALCGKHYIQVGFVPKPSTITCQPLRAVAVQGSLFLCTGQSPLLITANRLLKRSTDIIGALVGLSVSLPLMLLLAPLVKRQSGGSLFYGQTRVGLRGKQFTMWKLRSMKADAEDDTGAIWAVRDDARCTPVGAWMRRWNIDETPQFWNVLKGEMSLAGPRPERPEFTDSFAAEIDGYNPRHLVRPGMSGWAQIGGHRGDTSIEERLRFDLYYIENWSLWMDIQIFFLTFFRRENAY